MIGGPDRRAEARFADATGDLVEMRTLAGGGSTVRVSADSVERAGALFDAACAFLRRRGFDPGPAADPCRECGARKGHRAGCPARRRASA